MPRRYRTNLTWLLPALPHCWATLPDALGWLEKLYGSWKENGIAIYQPQSHPIAQASFPDVTFPWPMRLYSSQPGI